MSDEHNRDWPERNGGDPHHPQMVQPRRQEPLTRRPMIFWDRAKLLILLGGAWLVMLWSTVATNPLVSFKVAFAYTVKTNAWLLVLFVLELIRQFHYLICESSAGYHRFWSEKVFGGFDRSTHRMRDFTRFRVARVLKWLFFLFLIDMILAKALKLHPAIALLQLPVVVWHMLPVILQFVLVMALMVSQFVAIFWFLSKGGVETYMPEDIKTRFSDVWGQDHVLERVKENIMFLEDPEAIEEKGGHVPSGILLWGPPGTGKTLMAEAVAGETGRPFVFVEPGAFNAMFVGIGILKVKSLYRKLRKLALRYGGVIVFLDEADSLGSRGMGVGGGLAPGMGKGASPACHGTSYMSPNTNSLLFREMLTSNVHEEPQSGLVNKMMMGMGMGGGAGMGALQALLTEMSGLKKPRGFFNRIVRKILGLKPKPPPKYRILTIMATNMPNVLDEALLRPGRIDRIYKVGYPSKAGRVRTYEGYFSKVRHNLTHDEIDKLATITPYATGASIKDMVNEALISSIRDGRDWITWQDVVRARLLKALGPGEDVEYIERERHATAVHEACHAVIAYRVRRHLVIDIATIEKGNDYLGMVSSIPLEEWFTEWRSEFDADIMVSLASLAGEKMFFDGDNSNGVTGDLQSATTLAFYMEGMWGMGQTIGSELASKSGAGNSIYDRSRSVLQSELGRRVEAKLHELNEKTLQLLRENRLEILAVAHALETHKTLTGDDVEAVIEGRKGPLVDGRLYKTPDFAELVESYHTSAVDVHKKGHGKFQVPLPVLNGRLGVGALAMETEERHPDGV